MQYQMYVLHIKIYNELTKKFVYFIITLYQTVEIYQLKNNKNVK